MDDQNHQELRRAARLLKRAMWSGTEVRRIINEVGITVAPANFYSIIPSLDDIESSFEYVDEPPFLDPRIFDHDRMVAYLEDELMPYSIEFDPPVESPSDPPDTFYWGNPAFSYSDAMSYYCTLRSAQPRTVLEIGSGYSTLVAAEAIRRNGHGRLVCIEPFPMPWLRDVDGIELLEDAVQGYCADWFNDLLDDGDVLFIDSTHAVKSGSDCTHLYLRVIPNLVSRLLIHAHDIYLPYGLPAQKVLEKNIYWNEGYVLMALLADNLRMRVLYGSYYHHRLNREGLRRFMHGRHQPGGASIWMLREPSGSS